MNSVLELPFNRFIGLQTADEPHLLALPAGEEYRNHLGTVHASALLALAEASSGEWLLRQLGGLTGIIPVVRRLESKFRKPANGRVNAQVTTQTEHTEALKTDIAAKGRAMIEVCVELHDEDGQHVLSASVEWFITRAA
jgi:acyl-coenzyme A thioesterase PaaI-like protein